MAETTRLNTEPKHAEPQNWCRRLQVLITYIVLTNDLCYNKSMTYNINWYEQNKARLSLERHNYYLKNKKYYH